MVEKLNNVVVRNVLASSPGRRLWTSQMWKGSSQLASLISRMHKVKVDNIIAWHTKYLLSLLKCLEKEACSLKIHHDIVSLNNIWVSDSWSTIKQHETDLVCLRWHKVVVDCIDSTERWESVSSTCATAGLASSCHISYNGWCKSQWSHLNTDRAKLSGIWLQCWADKVSLGKCSSVSLRDVTLLMDMISWSTRWFETKPEGRHTCSKCVVLWTHWIYRLAFPIWIPISYQWRRMHMLEQQWETAGIAASWSRAPEPQRLHIFTKTDVNTLGWQNSFGIPCLISDWRRTAL